MRTSEADQRTYFEDVSIGDSHAFGGYEVTKEEIIDFAEQYDPQPLHLDEEAAAETMFGGLIASGWHLFSMVGRLIVDNLFEEARVEGGLGVEEVQWMKPARPGDTLSVALEVVDKQPWAEDLGLVKLQTEVFNQDDDLLGTAIGLYLYRRREG